MQPIDKFGKPIFIKTYDKMLGFGRILKNNGYVESRSKPNLFFRKALDVVFFADMRGTEIVPIWEDPSPLIYARFEDTLPQWKKRRLFKQELDHLQIARLSFYEESEPDGLMFGVGGDGFCVTCGKDFKEEGNFCSERCAEVYKNLGKTRCRVCGKSLDYSDVIEHHISYEENKTITVCRSCHGKIHMGNSLPKLKPHDVKDK